MNTDTPAAADILRQAAELYDGRIVFASSFGAEDQVLTHMIAGLGLDIPISTLDTGRLFPETYDLWAQTERTYGIRITPFMPDTAEAEKLVLEKGINLFRHSIDERHDCCRVRKLRPLTRMLSGKSAWICGLRSAQSITRRAIRPMERDETNGLVKISPLADWSEEDVWDYIRAWNVPYNPLHDRGYPSIGCACCTRAVKRTEDVRAGRWWWEPSEHRECGLHRRPQQ